MEWFHSMITIKEIETVRKVEIEEYSKSAEDSFHAER